MAVDYGIDPEYQKKLLTRKEEIELVSRVRIGDMNAKNDLILHNQRLVAGYVESNHGNFPDERKLDFYQVGCMGLIKAAETFDTSKKCKFSTHANWWIRQYIGREIRNNSKNVRIPVYLQEYQSKLRKINNYYISGLGRKPTLDEICTETEWEIDLALKVLKSNIGVFYTSDFYEQFNRDDLDKGMLLEKVNSILDTFDNRSRMIIESHYGINGYKKETLEKIGKRLGYTRERIRQLKVIALNKFRRVFDLPPLKVGWNNRKKRKSSNGSKNKKAVA